MSGIEMRFIFAVPFGKRLRRNDVGWETKKKFIDRLDRAHNQDLRKIVMMKLGKKKASLSFGIMVVK